MVIWGTDVVVADTKERFRQFILNFKDESVEEYDPTQALYLQKLEEVYFFSYSLSVFKVTFNHKFFIRNTFYPLAILKPAT